LTYLPSRAVSFTVTVPTRAAAEDLADALAARGHLLVAVREVDHFLKDPASFWYGKPTSRPEDQGKWDVFSLVAGPVPDDDTAWWSAVEEQAVRRLSQRLDGRSGGGAEGATDVMVRTFARVGLVHELDDATASARRLAALAACPARDGERDPRQVDENLPDGPGQPIPAGGLDSVDWGGLAHAYGPATNVPDLLRGLAANDDGWDEVLSEVCGSVLHQGSTYSSTAATVRVLAGLAAAPQLAPRRRLDLLYILFLAGSALAQAEAQGYRADAHAAEVRATVISEVDRLLVLWGSVSQAEQRLPLMLAALAGRAVKPTGLTDPASRLAQVMVRDLNAAEGTLGELARRNEDLLEYADGDAPLHHRLVASLQTLISQP
jgi:hypothetical protein